MPDSSALANSTTRTTRSDVNPDVVTPFFETLGRMTIGDRSTNDGRTFSGLPFCRLLRLGHAFSLLTRKTDPVDFKGSA